MPAPRGWPVWLAASRRSGRSAGGGRDNRGRRLKEAGGGSGRGVQEQAQRQTGTTPRRTAALPSAPPPPLPPPPLPYTPRTASKSNSCVPAVPAMSARGTRACVASTQRAQGLRAATMPRTPLRSGLLTCSEWGGRRCSTVCGAEGMHAASAARHAVAPAAWGGATRPGAHQVTLVDDNDVGELHRLCQHRGDAALVALGHPACVWCVL